MISNFCVVVHGNPVFEHAFLRYTLRILHLPISSVSIDDARETYITKEHQVERKRREQKTDSLKSAPLVVDNAILRATQLPYRLAFTDLIV